MPEGQIKWYVRYNTQLAQLLTEEGTPISDSSVPNWIYGKKPCPMRVVCAIARVLNLSEQEKMDLAYAFSYLQDVKAA